MNHLLKIYLAAPLFSETERRRNRELRDLLLPVAETFLPQEDGSLLTELIARGYEVGAAKRLVFEMDIFAIRGCDVLLLVMDGRSVDEGACFELGYAFSLGKRCVAIKTDSRCLLPIGDNPMLEGALERIFTEDGQIVDWVSCLQELLS